MHSFIDKIKVAKSRRHHSVGRPQNVNKRDKRCMIYDGLEKFRRQE